MTEQITVEEAIAEAEGMDFEAATLTPVEEAPYIPLLKVWDVIFESTALQQGKRVSPDWAAVTVSRWPFIKFSDMDDIQKNYFRIMNDLHKILKDVIEADPAAATEPTSGKEDVDRNYDHFIHLLYSWQKALIVEQAEWDSASKTAAAHMVAIGESQLHVTGQQGLSSYLGLIGLPFTDDDQTAMEAELKEFRVGLEA